MTMTASGGRGGLGRWRAVVWGGAGLLLLAPWVAMRFSNEMAWDGFDFAVFGVMLATACAGFELAARMRGGWAYRAGAAFAILAIFLLVWVNLAVGFIGSEDNPANLLFGGVIAVAVLGAAVARLRPRGTGLAMTAAALAQAAVAAFGLAQGWDVPLKPTVVFVALWLGSAGLFWTAGRVR